MVQFLMNALNVPAEDKSRKVGSDLDVQPFVSMVKSLLTFVGIFARGA